MILESQGVNIVEVYVAKLSLKRPILSPESIEHVEPNKETISQFQRSLAQWETASGEYQNCART
jgi:hypothetical protein